MFPCSGKYTHSTAQRLACQSEYFTPGRQAATEDVTRSASGGVDLQASQLCYLLPRSGSKQDVFSRPSPTILSYNTSFLSVNVNAYGR